MAVFGKVGTGPSTKNRNHKHIQIVFFSYKFVSDVAKIDIGIKKKNREMVISYLFNNKKRINIQFWGGVNA